MLTTDRNHPSLGHGESEGQNKVYLILSEEERLKGFMRPVRTSYTHVGVKICGKPKKFEHEDIEYVCKSAPHEGECGPVYTALTAKQKDSFERTGQLNGCGSTTTMGIEIAETYARDPYFYGYTFCVGCNKHLPVEEFVWEGTSEKVGS